MRVLVLRAQLHGLAQSGGGFFRLPVSKGASPVLDQQDRSIEIRSPLRNFHRSLHRVASLSRIACPLIRLRKISVSLDK